MNLTDRVFSSGSPITIRAYPGEQVLLTNNVGEMPALYVARSGGVRIEGISFRSQYGDGIKVANSSNIEIVGNTFDSNGMMGIYVGGSGSSGQTYSEDVQIWGNRFTGNGGWWPNNDPYAVVGTHSIYYGGTPNNTDGIRHGTVDGVIANNLFYDQPNGHHVQVGSQADGLIITNNTFVRAYQTNSRSANAVQIYGESNQYATKNVVVVNNVIADNLHRGVYGSGPTMTSNTVRYNLAYNNPWGDFVPQYGSSTLFTLGPGNITGADPKFVNPGGDDFRLRSDSPAIGRADAAYAPPTDFTGNPRDSNPDIGAYEG